jgi:hypothetical protein
MYTQAKVFSKGDTVRYSCNLMHNGDIDVATPLWDALVISKDDDPVGEASIRIGATGISIYVGNNPDSYSPGITVEFCRGGIRVIVYDENDMEDDDSAGQAIWLVTPKDNKS